MLVSAYGTLTEPRECAMQYQLEIMNSWSWHKRISFIFSTKNFLSNLNLLRNALWKNTSSMA